MPDITMSDITYVSADASAEERDTTAAPTDQTPPPAQDGPTTLTTPDGLTLTVGRTARNGLTVTAHRDGADLPLWWIHQTAGPRTPAVLIEAILEAAANGSAEPASFDSMDEALGQAGAGWSKRVSESSAFEGATWTGWTSPGGLRTVGASDLDGQDVTGFTTGWFLTRTPVSRRGSRTWRTSASTPEVVVRALALTSVPKCQITDELLETLSGLDLSPAARSANKMFVGARRTDSVLSRTIGSIALDSGRWAGNVMTSDGHEQQLPGTSCCVQHAMAAVWTNRQV